MRKILFSIATAFVCCISIANADLINNEPYNLSERICCDSTHCIDNNLIESSYCDTIIMIGSNPLVYCWGDNDTREIMCGSINVSNDPTFNVDSIGENIYLIDNVGNKAYIDITDTSQLKTLIGLESPLRGFNRANINYKRDVNSWDEHVTSSYSLTFDNRTDYGKDVQKWLKYLVLKSVGLSIDGSFTDNKNYICNNLKEDFTDIGIDSLARCCAYDYFSKINGSINYLTTDLRARVANDRFVTYRIYANNYAGGAHGMYFVNLVSYDLVNKEAINNKYLFKKGSEKDIENLLLEAMLNDKNWNEWHPEDKTKSDIKERLKKDWTEFFIPEAGLTEDGLMFSFQPYEIDCFAAGCLHFTLPYSAVKPYLTEKAKLTIGI